jgi:uncharacterized membrane protein YeiH
VNAGTLPRVPNAAVFTLPIYLDLGATFLFGITGALAALRRGYDVVGLFALALVTGLGGGLLRDGLFIQSGPPVATTDARFVVAIVAACVVAVLLGERLSSFNRVINIADALGLGAYAAVGVQKSLGAGLSAPAAALVGVVNACAGGVLRDLLTREEPLLFKPGQFYVLAAALGSVLYAAMVREGFAAPATAAWICVAVTFVFRALAIRYDWKTTALRD